MNCEAVIQETVQSYFRDRNINMVYDLVRDIHLAAYELCIFLKQTDFAEKGTTGIYYCSVLFWIMLTVTAADGYGQMPTILWQPQ
jgi:hypothetical protein